MSHILTEVSTQLAAAVERLARSVVQVHGQRRPVAGVAFAKDLIAAPVRALGDDTATVRLSSGDTIEGHVLGQAFGTGIGVVRVDSSPLVAPDAAGEPRVGSLALAVGRTWSGSVIASVTSVAVVGGPLRTGRASEIQRVIRIAQPPHGAFTGGALGDGEGRLLGLITGAAIRGTAVVIPTTLAWEAAHQIVERGGVRQGYLGISGLPVHLSPRQQSAGSKAGLLLTGVAPDSPADHAGLLVGDVILQFAGTAVEEPEALVTLLRGDHIGKPVTLWVLRGVQHHEVVVLVGERPSRRD